MSLLASCWTIGDPGYRMQPVGLEKAAAPGYQWAKKFDGFELQAKDIGGLIGEWWIDPQLTISTDSQPVTIESIELRTAKRIYPASINDKSKVIPAFSDHKLLSISWRFSEDTPAPEILGDSSRIVLYLKVGNETKTIDIDYKRVKCC
jgi:hypothetical protein